MVSRLNWAYSIRFISLSFFLIWLIPKLDCQIPYANDEYRKILFQKANEHDANGKSSIALRLWYDVMRTTDLQYPDSVGIAAHKRWIEHFLVKNTVLDTVQKAIQNLSKIADNTDDPACKVQVHYFQYLEQSEHGQFVIGLEHLDAISNILHKDQLAFTPDQVLYWQYHVKSGEGFCYAQLNEIESAKNSYLSASFFLSQASTHIDSIKTYMNISVSMRELNELANSGEYIEQASAICTEGYIPMICDMVVLNMSQFLADNGRNEEALNYLNDNFPEENQKLHPNLNSAYYGQLGAIYLNLKMFDLAEHTFLTCVEISEQHQYYFNTLHGLQGLVDTYVEQSDYEKAYHYQKEISKVEEIIKGQNLEKRIGKLERQKQLAEDNEKISALERDKEIIVSNRLKQLIISLLIIGLVLSLAFVFYLRTLKYEKERETIEKEMVASKLQALSLNMNPHFVFNSFNTLLNFIIKKKQSDAIDYLSKMSSIIRSLLGNAEKVGIPLNKELEILESYIHLEKLRFDFDLEFILNVEEQLLNKNPNIPSMILQPHLENALIHGLKSDAKNGKLELILTDDDEMIKCIIRDNGVGRQAAESTKSNRNHLHIATFNTNERVQLLKKMGYPKSKISVIDLKWDDKSPKGTEVTIYLPMISADILAA